MVANWQYFRNKQHTVYDVSEHKSESKCCLGDSKCTGEGTSEALSVSLSVQVKEPVKLNLKCSENLPLH